jgi:hypothetical protein
MLAPVALLADPIRRQALPSLGQEVSYGAQALGGMGKIQDVHRIRPMQIDEPLQPISSIGDGTHLCRLYHPAAPGLDLGQVREGGGVRQAREVGPGAGLDLLVR